MVCEENRGNFGRLTYFGVELSMASPDMPRKRGYKVRIVGENQWVAAFG
jgi:hypothetical protein